MIFCSFLFPVFALGNNLLETIYNLYKFFAFNFYFTIASDNTSMTNIFTRKELKYRITKDQEKALLARLQDSLKPDVYFDYRVYSIYYDSANLDLMTRCHPGSAYKEKVRLRSYIPNPKGDDPIFLELKKKIDGVCVKRRKTLQAKDLDQALMPTQGGIVDADLKRIEKNLPDLAGRFFLSAHRNCYVWKDDEDLRITFDDALYWREKALTLDLNPTLDRPLIGKDEVILEIKCASNLPLKLVRILDELDIVPDSFSKAGAVFARLIQEGALTYGYDNSHSNSRCRSVGTSCRRSWRPVCENQL